MLSLDLPAVLLIVLFQLLATATAVMEKGDPSTALHVFTQAHQQSSHEAEAALHSPATSNSKSLQSPTAASDLKSAQVGQGMALHGRASCHRALNSMADAQECYTESLRVLTKSLGSQHPELASVWNNLGSLQSQLNRPAAALECFEHAMDVLKMQSNRSSNLHLSKVIAPRSRIHDTKSLFRRF